MKCIICNKRIKPLEPELTLADPVSGMWDDAGVHEFVVGYGSRHDTERFVIGICDDCLDKLIEEGII